MTAPSHHGAAPSWDAPPPRFDLNEDRAADGHLGGFEAVTDVAACILPLLSSLGWEGDLVHVAESLPHFADTLDLTDLLNILANLGYASRSLELAPSRMDLRLMPCLYMAPGKMAMVLVRRDEDDDGKIVAFDAEQRAYVTIELPKVRGRIYRFAQLDEDERAKLEDAPKNFVFAVTNRFKPLFVRMLAASLVSNLLVLVTPLFIMAIYDQFLPTGSVPLLVSLLAGSIIAILGDYAIRGVRSRMIAYMGARLDHLLGLAIFRRLLMLAPPYTEQANSNSQIARLRDFEMVREFFTGPLATTLAEAPFIIVFLLAMALLGGPLVFVPLGALVLFTMIAFATRPVVERKVNAATRAASRRQEFLVEALSKPRAIKEAGAAGIWGDRFRTLSADAALKSHESTRANVVVATASQGLVMLTGIITLGWGVERVLLGSMTVGGLMASMIVVWWILRPLQTGFTLAAQIERVQASIGQINRLMQLKPERQLTPSIQTLPQFKGKVTLTNVSLRYAADSDPAVLGLALQAEPGEVVALIGPNGSGKSTVLKLLLGLYRPQTGAVMIDDIDIRQLDPIELRRLIAYVPQQPDMYFGTVGQNLRLARPEASDEELRWACQEAGLLEDILELPRQFETKLGDGATDRLPASFRQRLSLARAYLKRAPITLFDEPASSLDFMSDRQFMKTLERMKGHSTVFLVTHRPSHLKLADKIVVLVQGQVRMVGPAKQVLDRLPPNFF
ncbi:peptidase domain-containing ABC transporter [Magnetospirillum gryphiswaldense]|uniref:Hemolysin B n=1 Tax=Magnetospirillum gryphiswaldense TaxID=55518 RepID=A4U2Q3_9PROT|nr:peptidase domain-containing ABC transporter [Magnetospirillum gryphiswaldense]AVM74763.1 Toxin RTX-I translocation ATP-binding protein [Magnetospirillum gryphiswaldense MSR-1]AVM78666.1 Toxin RTX-I translocation ATP-binding protein [Magnetospirillum gryphiswaldense]CAM77160.1 Hemolysin B [Magnetospirillum gryphiswaldense MSR-1]